MSDPEGTRIPDLRFRNPHQPGATLEPQRQNRAEEGRPGAVLSRPRHNGKPNGRAGLEAWGFALGLAIAAGIRAGLSRPKQYRPTSFERPWVGGNKGKPLAERFWEKVDKRGPDECWPWLASFRNGFSGQIKTPTGIRNAASVAWELERGPVPEGHTVYRTCRTRGCTNIAHLRTGTLPEARRAGPIIAGEKHPLSVISDAGAAAVLACLAAGEPVVSIAQRFGISRALVYGALHGESWPHLPRPPGIAERAAAVAKNPAGHPRRAA